MTASSPLRIAHDTTVPQVHIFTTEYVNGILLLLLSLFFLYQQKAPYILCYHNQNQCLHRRFNAANFYLFRGISYMTAGLVSQFCPCSETAYNTLWSFSIIFYNLSVFYLLILIGAICTLNGWSYCASWTRWSFGQVSIPRLVLNLAAIVCCLFSTMYDLVMFDKYAALTLEAFVLAYFMLYVIVDGCYSHGGKYGKTVWLFAEYILVAWTAFVFFVFVIDRDREQARATYLMSIYNVTNCVAYVLLFAGLVWEQRVSKQVNPTGAVIENASRSSEAPDSSLGPDHDSSTAGASSYDDDVDNGLKPAKAQNVQIQINSNVVAIDVKNQENNLVVGNGIYSPENNAGGPARHEVHSGLISPFTEQAPMLDFSSADLYFVDS